MVTVQGALRQLYRAAFIAGATASGGPAAGAAAAALLNTPQGQAILQAGINFTLANEDIDTGNFATGGMVTSPTLAMIGEAGPEMVLPLVPTVSKRKPSAYNRKYSAAYRRIKRSKTLKNGRMAKGYSGRAGHNRIVKMAHAEVKKKMRRKK